jgi:hypothetical protein
VQTPANPGIEMAIKMGDYVRICDDLAAGAMLWHIVDMSSYPKNTIEKHGKKWLVSTRREIMKVTGLTKYSYDKALDRLKQMNFIETIPAGSGFAPCTNAFFMTDFMRSKLDLSGTYSGTYQAAKQGQVPDGHAPQVPDGQAPYKKEEVSKTQDKKISTLLAVKKVSEKQRIDSISKTAAVSISVNLTQSGVQQLSKEASKQEPPQGPPTIDGPITTYVMEKIYREAFKQFDPNYFHVTWGSRARGIAKVFMKQVTDKRVVGVMHHCIVNWIAFREFAQSGTSLHVPDRPDMLVLSTHAAAAVTFCEHGAKPKTTGWGKPKTADDFK